MIIFYSFRTNKVLREFENNKISVFVFGSIKKDFEKFSQILKKRKSDMILGFASSKGKSRSESITINRFGRHGKISRGGKEAYDLKSFARHGFKVSKVPTRSFCNWTMYKIKEFLESGGNSGAQVGFIHFNPDDTTQLLELCKGLTRNLF